MLVKHTVVDETAVERTHPMFYSPVEQWEDQIAQIQRLRPFEALVRLPSWRIKKARFPLLPLSPFPGFCQGVPIRRGGVSEALLQARSH
jgi:hypothetical protein